MSSSSDSDERELARLARRATARDKVAAERLIHAVAPRMERFLRRKGLSWHDVEEIAQDAWLRIFANLTSYDPNRNFLNWAFTITRNVWLDRERRDSRRPARGPLEDDPEKSDPAALLDWLEVSRVCLDKLSEEYRTIFLLRFQAGHSLARIAQQLALTEPSVRSKCCRAVQKYIDCIRENETKST